MRFKSLDERDISHLSKALKGFGDLKKSSLGKYTNFYIYPSFEDDRYNILKVLKARVTLLGYSKNDFEVY